MKTKLFRAESYLSVLVIISVFIVVFFGYIKWQGMQTKQEAFLYQQQQALQIAENQIALKMAGKACERSIRQNSLHFLIRCSEREIIVSFPLGEIKIGKP